MAYLGVSPSNGVRKVHTYTATASQTNFSGAGDEGITLSYTDGTFTDVYQNGVLLGTADYTATSGTSIVLTQAASADDIIVVIVYDVFGVADTVSKVDGGTFDGNITVSGTFTTSSTSTFGGTVLPSADDTHDLGSSSKQWRDIYTGDINLNNTKTRDNEVDGTRGSWTIQEGADDLFLLNRLNGKKYKFKLEEM